jgi:hypothetical protein
MSDQVASRATAHATARRRGAGGRLKIGDEWMAIRIIAQSQSNPQKAVAELVENALDAGAKRITLARGKKRGRVYLRVSDDGHGVPLSPEGVPDFDYVATHICDSLKRRLDERQRAGVQGEFGIGLLGFWAIGREMEMVSQTGDAPPHVMSLRSGSRHYDRRRYLGRRLGDGVDVTIHEVHRTAQSRLTAEKLQRYLGEELRERIRRAGATIVIEDRLPPRRTLTVQPAAYRGRPIEAIASIAVEAHPPVRAELYLAAPAMGAERGAAHGAKSPAGAPAGAGAAGETSDAVERPEVGLYRLGTRVCRHIGDLPEFDRPPWTGGGLEGALDYPDFLLSPATREGFVPDDAYHAFVEAMCAVEPALLEMLRREEEARSERASRSLVRELQSAFARLLRDLPSGDYDWFGAAGARRFAGGGSGRAAGPGEAPAVDAGAGPADVSRADAVAGADASVDPAAFATTDPAAAVPPPAPLPGEEDSGETEPPVPEPPALVSGPVATLTLRPSTVRVAVGRRRGVRAIPTDVSGLVVGRPLEWSWTLTGEVGALIVEPEGVARIEAGLRPARGTLMVRAREPGAPPDAPAVSATAEVLVEAEAARRAFPPPVFVRATGESWRSRWDAAAARLEVNSAHPDYEVVRLSASRRRRYLARLYAKELVLHNFGLETPDMVLERMLEVLTRLDEHL